MSHRNKFQGIQITVHCQRNVIRQEHLSPVKCGHSQYVHSLTDFLHVTNITHNLNDTNFNEF